MKLSHILAQEGPGTLIAKGTTDPKILGYLWFVTGVGEYVIEGYEDSRIITCQESDLTWDYYPAIITKQLELRLFDEHQKVWKKIILEEQLEA